MSQQLQLRRGNTEQMMAFTGAVAEVTVDTDKNTLVVHDGVTPGGHYVAAETGDITFSGNTIFSNTGNIVLTASNPTASPAISQAWTFDTDGKLTLPENADIVFANGSSALTGTLLTVGEINSTSNATSNTVTSVKTIRFDTDAGFDVKDLGGGVVMVGMNSTFKYWEVNGVQQLTAEGIDTVNFKSSNGISIVANSGDTPQSLTFDGHLIYNAANNASNVAYMAINTACNAIEAANSGITLAQAAYDKANTGSISNAINFTAGGQLYNNVAYLNTNTTVDTFNSTEFRTAKYLIQSVSDTDVHSVEVLLTHNNTDVFLTEYATLKSGANLITIDATLTNNTVSLVITPSVSNTIIDFVRTSLTARTLTVPSGNSAPLGNSDLLSGTGTEDLMSGTGSEDLMV